LIYRAFFRLVLQRIDSEHAHALAATTMRFLGRIPGYLALSDWLLAPRDGGLRVRLKDLQFRTPLGVAAGMDKDAIWFDSLSALGFGAVEVGTATAQAQKGNREKPWITRLPKDRGLINAMGFPNDGAAKIADRLAARSTRQVLGVNVGKTKVVNLEDAVADYRESVRVLAPYADYLALNVSSPNTPGLREMQTVDHLTALITGVREELRIAGRGELPLMIKLAPDLSDLEIEQIAEMAVRLELDGIIAVNTTVDMSVAPHSAAELETQRHRGGISGRPLRRRSLEVLRLLHAYTDGSVPLVSVGGLESPEDAWERILAGATLLQAQTAFVYEGPLWARRMNRGLARCLRESQWSSIEEAIGGSQRPSGGPVPPVASIQSVPGDQGLRLAGRS
jgi:dihydroorotate dehydrogenase